MIFGVFYLFQHFPISLLPVMSYMTLSSQEKPIISENNSLMTPFLLCSSFSSHPTNSASQNIGGTNAWAVKFFWVGTVPPRSPPVNTIQDNSNHFTDKHFFGLNGHRCCYMSWDLYSSTTTTAQFQEIGNILYFVFKTKGYCGN